MTREELIKHCKYYKGEEECPYKGDAALVWDYENLWVKYTLDGDSVIRSYQKMYKDAGLEDFRIGDGVPKSLKAFIFGRYCYWYYYDGEIATVVPDFVTWYNKLY